MWIKANKLKPGMILTDWSDSHGMSAPESWWAVVLTETTAFTVGDNGKAIYFEPYSHLEYWVEREIER